MRKVLFTGWGIGDTHAGPSNLRWGLDNWVWGIVGYSGFRGTVGGETHPLRPGLLPLQARRLEARVPPQHEQQLVGRRLQRGGARLRLDGQRLPERLPADPQPLLRGGARLVAVSAARASPRRTRFYPDHRQGPPGRLPRRLHGRGRPCPLHGPDLSARSTGTRPRSSPSRPGTWSPRSRSQRKGSDVARLLRLEPARQRRRMDRADHGRGRARRPRLGDRLVQLHRPAQPDAARLQDRQGQRLRDAAARQDARPDLPRRLQGRRGRRSRRCSTRPTPTGLVAALRHDNQFWRLHAQRLLVERGKTDVVPGADRARRATARSMRSA